jgi:hypothetical protein
MMTDDPIRFFSDDAAVRHVGEGFLACCLPKTEWTHEAHLATCLWLIVERSDVDAERDLPSLIARYNEAVGGINDATQGYHHTITLTYVASVRSVLARTDPGLSLVDTVNTLLASPEGRRDWPLTLYSRDRLFSAEARLGYLPPDLAS